MSTLADFVVEARLGHGASGVVYRVRRRADNMAYCLKQISLLNADHDGIDATLKEVELLSSLNSPFILSYRDSFIDGDCLNIITELASESLEDFLSRRKEERVPLTEEEVLRIACQCTRGLADLHEAHILHRDIKASNLLLDHNGNVKIGDLGVAKLLSESMRCARTTVGTPYAFSPELVEEKPYDEKSDIWALGTCLYQMCTFRHPFEASNQAALLVKILRGQYAPVPAEAYSPALRRLVERCLTREPRERPSAAELLASAPLAPKARELGIPIPAPGPPAPAPRRKILAPAAPPLEAAGSGQSVEALLSRLTGESAGAGRVSPTPRAPPAPRLSYHESPSPSGMPLRAQNRLSPGHAGSPLPGHVGGRLSLGPTGTPPPSILPLSLDAPSPLYPSALSPGPPSSAAGGLSPSSQLIFSRYPGPEELGAPPGEAGAGGGMPPLPQGPGGGSSFRNRRRSGIEERNFELPPAPGRQQSPPRHPPPHPPPHPPAYPPHPHSYGAADGDVLGGPGAGGPPGPFRSRGGRVYSESSSPANSDSEGGARPGLHARSLRGPAPPRPAPSTSTPRPRPPASRTSPSRPEPSTRSGRRRGLAARTRTRPRAAPQRPLPLHAGRPALADPVERPALPTTRPASSRARPGGRAGPPPLHRRPPRPSDPAPDGAPPRAAPRPGRGGAGSGAGRGGAAGGGELGEPLGVHVAGGLAAAAARGGLPGASRPRSPVTDGEHEEAPRELFGASRASLPPPPRAAAPASPPRPRPSRPRPRPSRRTGGGGGEGGEGAPRHRHRVSLDLDAEQRLGAARDLVTRSVDGRLALHPPASGRTSPAPAALAGPPPRPPPRRPRPPADRALGARRGRGGRLEALRGGSRPQSLEELAGARGQEERPERPRPLRSSSFRQEAPEPPPGPPPGQGYGAGAGRVRAPLQVPETMELGAELVGEWLAAPSPTFAALLSEQFGPRAAPAPHPLPG
eukprot:tig00001086_g6848.t1